MTEPTCDFCGASDKSRCRSFKEAEECMRSTAAPSRTFSSLTVPIKVWALGTRVRKKSGSSWQGHVVGYYSTKLTPIGYAIESENEPGSVQIYPAKALELVENPR